MTLETLKSMVKEIILGSMTSFTTTNNGQGICGVVVKNTPDKPEVLGLFKTAYLTYYGLKHKDIEGLLPLSLMLHVFGITEKALSTKEFNYLGPELLGYVISLYRQCGLTEIKKDK